jgi:hypothetical protein
MDGVMEAGGRRLGRLGLQCDEKPVQQKRVNVLLPHHFTNSIVIHRQPQNGDER